jgi:hypothetical protein
MTKAPRLITQHVHYKTKKIIFRVISLGHGTFVVAVVPGMMLETFE